MCLAKVYVKGKSGEPILEDITYMRMDGERLQMETLLGEEKTITGRVLEVDFSNSKIIVERYCTPPAESEPKRWLKR